VALDVADHAAVIRFCADNRVGFVVVGPEAPLVAGLADDLAAARIKVFGPSKAAARLEGSKGFTKDLCREFSIPTGAYGRFADARSAKAYLAAQKLPIVIKADGLAAGKAWSSPRRRRRPSGQSTPASPAHSEPRGTEIVIEEFLEGEEASFFALVDGEHVLPLAGAGPQAGRRSRHGPQYRRHGGLFAGAGDDARDERRTLDEIIRPTVRGMAARGRRSRGCSFWAS
jgi:phosphoribosylamine--glycine ligase